MNRKTQLRNVQGFTLLELLMVVIIVGILASLALPGYIRSSERARFAEAVTYLGQIKGAAQRFCVENNNVTFPTFPMTALNQMDIEDMVAQDPTGFGNRWLPITIGGNGPSGCTAGPTGGFAISILATRANGPCATSTVEMTYPATVAGQDYLYTWAPGTPCA